MVDAEAVGEQDVIHISLATERFLRNAPDAPGPDAPAADAGPSGADGLGGVGLPFSPRRLVC